MEILINPILQGALFTLLFQFDPWLAVLDRWLNFKPFNCTMCFTFWCTIGYNIPTFGWTGIAISAMAALIAELWDRKMNQL